MYWTDAWRLGASMWANGFALQETALATSGVLKHRGATIDHAMRNPLQADVSELGRMVPEKMAAFGKAGEAMAADWMEIQADLFAQSRDMMTLFAAWPPSPATIERIGRRGSRLAVKMSTAGGRALQPIHATATANHRRLDKAARKVASR